MCWTSGEWDAVSSVRFPELSLTLNGTCSLCKDGEHSPLTERSSTEEERVHLRGIGYGNAAGGEQLRGDRSWPKAAPGNFLRS